MKILITGCAGFIGFHVAKSLMSKKNTIYGIDSMNSYYDKNLKTQRQKDLQHHSKKNNFFFRFKKLDIRNGKNLNNFFKKNKIDYIVHLAAQPGVRYSLINPKSYITNNLNGFFNILECSKIFSIKHLIFASSSSVYGDALKMPLVEKHNTDHPLQLYAATKKANEVMGYSYSSLFNIPMTCLRFFTVYGPWGRPDMALFKFVKNILNDKTIFLHNNGNHRRDFTYVKDISSNVVKLVNKIPNKHVRFRVLNIGNGKTVKLLDFVKLIEKAINKKAKIKFIKKQKGEILDTHSSSKKLIKLTSLKNRTSLSSGIKKFVEWYKIFYKNNL